MNHMFNVPLFVRLWSEEKGTIILPPNSTGTTVSTNTVAGADREVVSIGDPGVANTASVGATAPGGTAQGLTVRNISERLGVALTTTALGIGGVFTQAFQDSNADGTMFVTATVFANVASAASGFIVQETDDTANTNTQVTVVSATVSANVTTTIYAQIRKRFWRVQYTNGGIAQTTFELTVTAATSTAYPVDASGNIFVAQAGAPWSQNVTQFGGNAVVTGTGASGLGIPRVTVSNDSTVILGAGAAVIGSLAANQSVNLAQLNAVALGSPSAYGTAPGAVNVAGVNAFVTNTVAVTLASTTITGTVAVTQSTTPWTVAGAAASGAAKSGNPVQTGWIFNTVQPTVLTGQAIEAQGTARGGLIVATGADVFNVTVTTALPTGANTIGGVTQATSPWVDNVTQIGGTAVVTGGVAGLLAAAGNIAHNTADTANPLKIGARAQAVQIAAVTDGTRTDSIADRHGHIHVRNGVQNHVGVVSTTVSPAFPIVANTLASATLAAGAAGVRHICTGITATIGAGATAPTAIQLTVVLRDGASGAGTIKWQAVISLPATAGAMSGVARSDLWIPGTAATAMTLEFSAAGGANTFESVSMETVDITE